MFISSFGCHSAFLCPVQKACLDQIRFVGIFDRDSFLSYRRSDRLDPYRSSVETLDDRRQDISVEFLKTQFVDAESVKGLAGDVYIDISVGNDS